MNGIVRTAFRLPALRSLTSPLLSKPLLPAKRDFARNLWHMSGSSRSNNIATISSLHKNSSLCSCGCGCKGIHTKGERELVEFLTEEIVAERKAQKVKSIPQEIEGYKVSFDGAEVTLKKAGNDETVTITLNVNHTVDADSMDDEIAPSKEEFTEMRSKPQFEVDITKGDTTLSFTCSYLQDVEPSQDDDVFGIDEITLYNGEWNDKMYAVAGDVLDGYLYDLLMNLLEEKGISNEFVEKLSDFSTAYEHSCYIKLLENISLFTTGKKWTQLVMNKISLSLKGAR